MNKYLSFKKRVRPHCIIIGTLVDKSICIYSQTVIAFNHNIYILYFIDNKGRLEEMDDWLTLDQEEPVETFFMENESGDDSLLVHFLKLFDKRIKQKKKKSSDQEEELKSHYNVYVYRVLRYPPTSKDVQDFIIQRN